ncbi:MAG: hypothetical protein RLZZ28_250 [Bacteroidota bacterium]|jgi:hypothetical protein
MKRKKAGSLIPKAMMDEILFGMIMNLLGKQNNFTRFASNN